ncbi:FG-GAP-like repeat-containing protein [Micromonospora cathayae]|uniref:CHAP domain-containing protein n=1 Tax=Micromonospora cathayae TaxID=3028804 RepID=A0ABY7ZU49_9ACTN|nr:FG-GAP-like repeat-containing protein [Micromonospora sp. HUAS 3]WDZ85553.1 CHAP domain-containing protein [Micromonospora sp. HUAS 3]
MLDRRKTTVTVDGSSVVDVVPGARSGSSFAGFRRSAWAAIVAVLAMLGGIALTATPANAAVTRQQIVNVATGQLGGTGCSPGYYNSCGIEWCAEFARWVWRTAGVSDTSGLDAWAQSFKTYGTSRGLYRSRSSGYVPQPGDAIVFDWDHNSGDSHPIDHVAIVTSVSSTQVNTIGGNQGNSNNYSSKVSRASYSRTNGDIDGYISPAGVGSGTVVDQRPVGHSVTGDSFSDLVGTKPDGTMWLYANNFVRDDGVPYSGYQQIGSGWGNVNYVVTADVTGDGYSDLVARRTDGTLWLYPNNIERDNGTPYSSPDSRQIGSGWGGFDTLVGADVTGDGFTDLVGRKTDGTLWLYSNNIKRDNGVPYSDYRQIGSGWGGFDRIVGADVTGDGYTDLVTRKTDGTLWMYPNNIVRDNGTPYSSPDSRQIGSGWGGFDRIIGADVTGDGYTDLVTRKTDGTLWMYPNNIERDNGDPYSSPDSRQIGSGWGGFTSLI